LTLKAELKELPIGEGLRYNASTYSGTVPARRFACVGATEPRCT
jgi:hypothetical protein